MKRFVFSLTIFAAAAIAAPMLTGCDRTVSEKTTVEKHSDGTTVTDKKKTVQSPDGDTKTTVEHKVDQ